MFELPVGRSSAALGYSVACAALAATASGCLRDSRNLHAALTVPARVPSGLESRSWGVCELVGPSTETPGIYGSDLGFTVTEPASGGNRLAMLFGDTWAKPIDACKYPSYDHDDLQAWLPARRPSSLTAGPPGAEARSACRAFGNARTDSNDPTSWPRIRLFSNTEAKKQDPALKSGALRTPVAAFSDGQRLYGVFYRGDPVYCGSSGDCPESMRCSSERAHRKNPIGQCNLPLASGDATPAYCRNDDDCPPRTRCEPSVRGVCLSAVRRNRATDRDQCGEPHQRQRLRVEGRCRHPVLGDGTAEDLCRDPLVVQGEAA